MSAESDRADSTLEYLAWWLDKGHTLRTVARQKHNRIQVGHFDLAEPIGMLDALGYDKTEPVWTDGRLADLDEPLNVCMIANTREEDGDAPVSMADGFNLIRARMVTLHGKAFRGRVVPRFPAVQFVDGLVDLRSSEFLVLEDVLSYGEDGIAPWRSILRKMPNGGLGDQFAPGAAEIMREWRDGTRESAGFASRNIKIAVGWQFNRQFHWHATVAFGDGPRVMFRTDPVGAREMFALREVPPGSSRRKALIHWVREHYRQTKRAPADPSLVRAHLRGETDFVWSDMRCSIFPSKECIRELADLGKRHEPIEAATAQREDSR